MTDAPRDVPALKCTCGRSPHALRRQGVAGIFKARWFRETIRCRCGERVGPFTRPGVAITAWNRRAASETKGGGDG